MNIPDNLLYTKEHEWVRIEGTSAKVGITDYAQSSLGDITFIDLPKKGDEVEQFKQLAGIESVKAASDVYAALSGKIIKVNEKLADSPQLINQAPYEDGWLAEIEVKNVEEEKNLLSANDYKSYLEGLAE